MRVPKTIVPNMAIVTLPWVHVVQVTLPFGVVSNTIDIYPADPNLPSTLSNHNPLGWDQWANFYQTATVLKTNCSVNISMVNNDQPTSFGMIAALTLNTSEELPIWRALSPDARLENPRTVSRVMAPQGTTNAQTTLRYTYRPKSFYKVKVLTDDTLTIQTEDASDTPDKNAVMPLWFGRLDAGGATTVDLHVILHIKMFMTIAFRNSNVLSLS